MADFYGTLAGALIYHTDRGNTAWVEAAEASPSEDDDLTAALVRASQYIDGRYSGRWPGTRTGGRDQALAWPRTDATDLEGNDIPDDEVPIEVEYATYEAALREFTTPNSLTPDFVSTQQIRRKRVDVLEIEYSDSSITATDVRPIVSTIDELLAGLIGPRSSTSISFPARA